MNINYNQRYFSTEEKIQRGLFSLLRFRKYNDISIKELCYEAGINRSSFYAHYQDINDLMIKIEQGLSKNIIEIFSPKKVWNETVFASLFDFLYQNRDFYNAYLDSNEQMFMEKNDFINFINIVGKNNRGDEFAQEEMIYHMAFFAGGLKAIAKSWIKRDCKETPAQMAKIITNEYKQNAKYWSEQ